MNTIMERHTLADLVLKYPAHRAHENVLTFLDAAGNEKTRFTFDELRHHCVQVAVNISLQVHARAVVLVELEDQADFVKGFFGCIMAGCIPAPLPAFPVRGSKKGMERTLQIIKEGEVKFVLVAEAQASWLSKEIKRAGLNEVRILTIESLTQLNAACRALPVLAPNDLAYLQYTSGSASAPKGVILTQENVLNSLAKMYRIFRREELVRVVGWLPFHHDMGLVGQLFTVLYESGQGIFMPPEAFLTSPEIWLQTISRYKANSAAAPTFSFGHCIRKIPIEAVPDLSSWKNVYVGSEPVSLDVLDGFYEKFRNAGFHRNAFRPVYGLAEATLLVAGGDKGLDELQPELYIKTTGQQQQVLVPYSLDTTYDEVTIHDPVTGTIRADGEQGEIFVKGNYNTGGYFRNTDDLPIGEQMIVKTGDLGFKQNGHLYITGRSKEVIIVRGANNVM